MLDFMGPIAFLNHVPGIEIHLIHDTLSPVPSGNASLFSNDRFGGVWLQPTYTLDNAPPLDVLLVPGGNGAPRITTDRKWDQFVAKVYPDLQYLYSVCTGASIVARSGIIDGKRATTNKAAFNWVMTQGPNVSWVKEARWVVDGNIWTSSGECVRSRNDSQISEPCRFRLGVEAGTDMAYAFVSAIYGERLAQSITNFIEYVPITNSSYDPFAALYNLSTPAPATQSISPSRRQVAPTSRWGILAFPGFIGLDVIGVGSYIEHTSLQAAYPGNISLIAHSLSPVRTASLALNGGPQLVPTNVLSNPPEIDILIVPGLATAGPFPYHDELVAYIRTVYPTLKHIMSVGTGSMLLAAAGVLDGRKATTSKALFYPATAPFRGKEHHIEWTTGRWVRDGNVWTTSGSAACLDATNALSIDLFGEAVTLKAANQLEYTPRTNASSDPFASIWGVRGH